MGRADDRPRAARAGSAAEARRRFAVARAHVLAHPGDDDRRHVARADHAAAATTRVSPGRAHVRRADGLGAVAAVRARPRSLPAVLVAADRRDRDRRRLPDRRHPQSGPPRRDDLRRAHRHRRPLRRGDGDAPRVDPVAAQGRSAGLRDGAQLHAGDDAALRRADARCSRAAASARRPAGNSSGSRFPRGRSSSSSR